MRTLLILCFLTVLVVSSCSRRVVVSQPNSVTVVQTLPRTYKVVKIRGKRYYYFNGRHYKKTKKGYVVVRV